MNRQRRTTLEDLKQKLEELQEHLEELKDEEEDEFTILIDKSDNSDFAVLFLEAAECRVEALENALYSLGEAIGYLESVL